MEPISSSYKNPANLSTRDFEKILDIKNVAVAKLTQALFLISPYHFFPIDEQGDDIFRIELKNVKTKFPACKFYEINFWRYKLSAKQAQRRGGHTYQYCIVEGDDENTTWNDVAENNHIQLPPKQATYSSAIAELEIGDIVLVRAANRTYGIGVVHRNDYYEKFNEPNHCIFQPQL